MSIRIIMVCLMIAVAMKGGSTEPHPISSPFMIQSASSNIKISTDCFFPFQTPLIIPEEMNDWLKKYREQARDTAKPVPQREESITSSIRIKIPDPSIDYTMIIVEPRADIEYTIIDIGPGASDSFQTNPPQRFRGIYPSPIQPKIKILPPKR